MADPNDAGTPTQEPVVSESAGTTGTGADGSESSGKPVDAALAMTWKRSAELKNAAEQRANELQLRLDAIERERYAQQQSANPLAQAFQTLAERAPYDADAQVVLSVAHMAAQQQQETLLTKAMMRAQIPNSLWDDVELLVRQSGYRMSVEQALTLARGKETPVLQDQLKAKEDEIARLKAALEGRTAPNGTQKVSMSTSPAPVGGAADEMPLEEYMAIMQRGGQAAIDLRDSGVRIRRG